MRRATHDTEWLFTEDGRLLGFALGYDFCAEHEWGTKDLRYMFGVALLDAPEGLHDRKITEVPQELRFLLLQRKDPRDKRRKKQPCAMLACLDWYHPPEEYLEREALYFLAEPDNRYYDASRHDVVAAWSSRDFAILVRGESNIQLLTELSQAFERQDILFGVGLAGGWAANRGLTFIIDSRVSAEDRQRVLEDDLDYKRLILAAEATGIVECLKAANLPFRALTPRWADESKSAVKFWLSPRDGRYANYGLYSLEDLKDWIRGTGPIPKNPRDEHSSQAQ